MAAVVHGTTQKGKLDAQFYQKLQMSCPQMSTGMVAASPDIVVGIRLTNRSAKS